MMDIEGAQRFHGLMCPGLAIGIRVSELALQEIGPHAGDEEVVATVEADNCAVDAIQCFTGCTFGKGNLIHRDYGRNASTFVRRSDGNAIRIVARPGSRDPLRSGAGSSLQSMACAGCGEVVMETRARLLRGQAYRIPCFGMRERRLLADGRDRQGGSGHVPAGEETVAREIRFAAEAMQQANDALQTARAELGEPAHLERHSYTH